MTSVMPTLASPAWATRPRLHALHALMGAALGGFFTVALLVVVQQAGANIWVVNAAMLAPAVATFVIVPSSRRHWYRWLVILVLAQIINVWATAPFLLVAVSWALWRSWTVERPTTVQTPRGAAHPQSVTKPRPKTLRRTPAGAK